MIIVRGCNSLQSVGDVFLIEFDDVVSFCLSRVYFIFLTRTMTVSFIALILLVDNVGVRFPVRCSRA